MSMIQLLGGVAVAGAVAAGTTAFTAGGLSLGSFTNTNARDNAWLGGSQSVSVTGNATLNKLSFTQVADSGSANANNVTGATLTFAAGLPSDAVVTMTTSGTLNDGGDGTVTGFHCSGVTANVATCAVSNGSATTPGTGAYYSGVTSVVINVS